MKRSLFKQIMMSALFACSLSADVPDVREQAEEDGLPTEAQRAKAGRQTPLRSRSYEGQAVEGGGRMKVGLAAHQTGGCSSVFCDSHALSQPIWLAAPLAGTTPDPLACALAGVWPLDGFGIHLMDQACVRWDMLPSVSQEAMNVPTDTRDAAFCVPRYRMPLALQESAWPTYAKATVGRPRPVGFWEPDQSLAIAGRSSRADMAAMIPRLKKIFTKEGVPQQWVWVAEVESALNPRAKSSAGAVGLFQLMPGTARRFGLQTTPVDDRMEPEKSAGAAAQYLKFLRREFGCWSLALAAYNAGEGRVKEIMKKRKARTFNEVERYLPSETRAYVPKVMAMVALREDQLHGVPGTYWMP